jgi:zinc protease
MILPQRFFLGLLPLILITLGCATTSNKSAPSGDLLVGSLRVQSKTLSNGLKILVAEDRASPTFAIQTWFNVGSRHEKQGYTGLAHLFEHMMFKGTKDAPEGQFDRTLEQAGADGVNAMTSHDYTVYVQELPKERLDLILKLEADRMTNLIVDQKTFATEREVVQNERRDRVENNPDGLMWQELFARAYSQHPYGWPVIGFKEDLERMTAEDAAAFYRNHYVPSNAVLVVVGDVNADEVFSLARKHYGSIPSGKPDRHPIPVEPEQTSPRRRTMELPQKVEKLYMAYKVGDVRSEDTAALEVLQGILTEGKSSRLSRSLVDSSIASSVSSGNYQMVDPSIFMFSVNLQVGKKAAVAETLILQELERLGREPIGADELARGINQMDYYFYEGLSSNSERARFLGRAEIGFGDFREALRLHQRIRSITPEQVRAVVQKYFSPQKRTVVVGVPNE